MIKTEKVVLLFGKICSGKSTYADALCYITNQDICHELCHEINKYDKVVIDGIRQYSIVLGLAAEFGLENLDLIWLEVPDDVRKYRFYDRSISKDDITFEDADARDEKLGLLELQDKLKDSYIIINN